MKRSCKNIDITDVDTILPFVMECCFRHYRRYDFKKLFLSFGLSAETYQLVYDTYDKSLLYPTIVNIAKRCAKDIKARKLDLPPIHIRIMNDTTTGKERQIGKETALQQCFDYIAVYSCMAIFKRRMVPEQASSIKKRGQLYGAKMISRWMKRNYNAMRYAKRHGLRYTDRCKWFVKLDIRKCYPTAKLEAFMLLFVRDCGNADIIWLWGELLASHRVDGYFGFMIGALPSQWACQLMIAYIYRHVKDMHYERRGKQYKHVEHMICFMDDMLFLGSNRLRLVQAVKSAIDFANEELGWEIKATWAVKNTDTNNIDMMGFVIRKDGSMSIRGRNFVHSRRMAMKFTRQGNRFTVTQARHVLSYKGYYYNRHGEPITKSRTVVQKYGFAECFKSAADTVSRYERKTQNGTYES